MVNRLAQASVLASVLALGACSKANAGEQSQGGKVGRQQAIVIRFADPGNAGVLAYAKREGILASELAKVDATIEWVPAAGAFSANFEAMNAGAINASGAAISPIVGALAHNLKFKIFSIGDPAEMKQAGLIAPKGSPIKKVEDLVGKRIAVNLAAHGDYMVLKALANHGIPADKVTRVPIQPPDAAAAFATGKIDAWSTFGIFFSTAVRNGAHVIAYGAELDSDDVTVTSANAEVLRKNPRAFQVFVKVAAELTQQAHREPAKFQNVFTDKGPTALSGDNLRIAIEETRRLPIQRLPTPADLRRIDNVSKIFFQNKSIDRPVAVDEIVFDVDQAVQEQAK